MPNTMLTCIVTLGVKNNSIPNFHYLSPVKTAAARTKRMSDSIDPFGEVPGGARVQLQVLTLHASDQDIADFTALLKFSKIGPETWENGSWEYGITREWLLQAKETWLNSFDWRAHEQHINSFPNFKAIVKDPIKGELGIHFAALFSKNSEAVPVMFMHGWPGKSIYQCPRLKASRP